MAYVFKRKLKQTKAAIAARKRWRRAKRAGKIKKRGCGKGKWKRGGYVYWKCQPPAKKHAYRSR